MRRARWNSNPMRSDHDYMYEGAKAFRGTWGLVGETLSRNMDGMDSSMERTHGVWFLQTGTNGPGQPVGVWLMTIIMNNDHATGRGLGRRRSARVVGASSQYTSWTGRPASDARWRISQASAHGNGWLPR